MIKQISVQNVQHFVGKVDGVYMDIAPVDGVKLKKDFKGRFKYLSMISAGWGRIRR